MTDTDYPSLESKFQSTGRTAHPLHRIPPQDSFLPCLRLETRHSLQFGIPPLLDEALRVTLVLEFHFQYQYFAGRRRKV